MNNEERAKLEEAGFEALQRLYAEAVDDQVKQGRVCARLLVGLYNGRRFPSTSPTCASCRRTCSRTR